MGKRVSPITGQNISAANKNQSETFILPLTKVALTPFAQGLPFRSDPTTKGNSTPNSGVILLPLNSLKCTNKLSPSHSNQPNPLLLSHATIFPVLTAGRSPFFAFEIPTYSFPQLTRYLQSKISRRYIKQWLSGLSNRDSRSYLTPSHPNASLELDEYASSLP